MVLPKPSKGPDASAILHEKREDPMKGQKSDPVQQKQATPASRQALSIANLSITVVVLAVMLAGLRPNWIPSPQEQPSMPTSPFHGVFEWVSNQGASVGDIEVVAFDGDYELVASKRLEKGQSLLSVPMSLILDENTIFADATVQAVLDTTNILDENGASVVFLLANQDQWGVYLEMIQSVNVPSTLFWAPDDVALLQGSMINRMMGELTAILNGQFAAVEPFFDGLTLDMYTRLWVNVNSRMWQLQKGETESFGALMPVFDFATHSPAPNVEVGYDTDLDAVVMTAVMETDPGEPIHNFYYNTSNIHHLLFQGFIVEDNDANIACEFDLNGRRCSVEANAEAPITDSVVRCVRDQQLDERATRNEVKTVWDQVVEAASTALTAFPDTIDNDDRILEQDGISSNAYNAIHARRSEKLCLTRMKSFSESLAQALATDSVDFEDVFSAETTASAGPTQAYWQSIQHWVNGEDGSAP